MNLTAFVLCSAICTLLLLPGCVSVNIGPKGPVKSEGVAFVAPVSPFEVLKDAKADGAWKNARTGSSIGYLSSCGDASDTSLEGAMNEMFSGLQNLKTVSSEPTRFNGREALVSEVEGTAEGVRTRVRAIVFKKNGCLYTLSLVGLVNGFEQDRSIFDGFAKGFRAP